MKIKRIKLSHISKAAVLAALSFILITTYNNCGKYNFTASSNAGAGLNLVDGIPSVPTDFSNTNCTIGYPFSSSNPATNVAFSETRVLAAYSAESDVASTPGVTINVWFGDEKALALGVRQVVVKNAGGTTTTTNYPVSVLPASPSKQVTPQVGATAMTGDQAGTDASNCSGAPDACSRPMWPALFVTDITTNPSSMMGDWQYGGTPIPPTEINGTWKSVVRTIDHTRTPAAVTLTMDADPTPNYWNLGPNIPAPTNAPSEPGFGAVASWNINSLNLQSGHSYRLQFMVHDGDQNKAGGDVGQNCVNIQIP